MRGVGKTRLLCNMQFFWGNKEIVELLIAEGADVNAKDNAGTTTLDWAESGVVDMLKQPNIKLTKKKSPTSSANTVARRVKNWKLKGNETPPTHNNRSCASGGVCSKEATKNKSHSNTASRAADSRSTRHLNSRGCHAKKS